MNARGWRAIAGRSSSCWPCLWSPAAGASACPLPFFPIDFPRVRVDLDAGDRPADRMGVEVTWPVEEAVRAIPGVANAVDHEQGQRRGPRQFRLGTGHDRRGPSSAIGHKPDRRHAAPGHFLHSPQDGPHRFSGARLQSFFQRGSRLLRDTALYQLRPRLSTVPGVAGVGVQGGETEEYRVTVDPQKLASYNMSLDEVSKALSASNVIEAVGKLEDHYKLYLVVSDTRLTLPEIGQTVLRSGENGVVTLNDVAAISKTPCPSGCA